MHLYVKYNLHSLKKPSFLISLYLLDTQFLKLNFCYLFAKSERSKKPHSFFVKEMHPGVFLLLA